MKKAIVLALVLVFLLFLCSCSWQELCYKSSCTSFAGEIVLAQGQRIRITGEVLIRKSGDGVTVCEIAESGSGQRCFLLMDDADSEEILSGDVITVYGTADGLYNDCPRINVVYYDFQ